MESPRKNVPPAIRYFGVCLRSSRYFRKLMEVIRFFPEKAYYGKGYTDTVNLGGLPFRALLGDHVDTIIWRRGMYEEVATNIFKRILKKGDCFLDIGANVGYYSVLSSSIMKGGKIISFEPVSTTYARLKENVGGIDFVEPMQMACGDENCFADINIADSDYSGNSKLIGLPPNFSGKTEKVRVVRVDDFLGERPDISRVDVVKIDTEGNELKTLKGMEKTVRANPDIKIFVEINSFSMDDQGYTPEDLFGFLKHLGLRAWRCVSRSGSEFAEADAYWGNESLVLFSRQKP